MTTEHQEHPSRRLAEKLGVKPHWTASMRQCYWPEVTGHDLSRLGIPRVLMSIMEPRGETAYFDSEEAAYARLESAYDEIVSALGLGEAAVAGERERCAKIAIELAVHYDNLIEDARGIEDELAYGERAVACREVADAIRRTPAAPEATSSAPGA